MSLKPKTIAFSVAALLAAAAGVYTLMPNDRQSVTVGQGVEGPEKTEAKAEPAVPSKSDVGNSGDNAGNEDVSAPSAQQTSAQNQPAVPAPKKLTRQQLTPPPATEEEKLQKAAEQENNF